MAMPSSSDLQLQDIVKYIENGDYRIPRFQRDFVWDSKKSAKLLDSIFRGYPLGSVILWNTKVDLNSFKEFAGIHIPGKATGRYTSYIIDGQQRLTSLFFAAKGLTTSKGKDYSKIVVYLKASGDEQIVYDSIPKGAISEDYISFKDLFAAQIGGVNACEKLKYYQILLQYKISAIEIDDSLSLEKVIEVFERLNLGGKRLSLFSIISARSYREKTAALPEFDFSERYKSFNQKLSTKNYGEISDSAYLESLAACTIKKVNQADILCDLTDTLVQTKLDDVEKAIEKAISYLQSDDFGVKVYALLPYDHILVAFTYFYYKVGNTTLSAFQQKYLKDFFWRCVIGRRYGSSANTYLTSDLDKIDSIIAGNVPKQEAINISQQVIYDNGEFKISSAFVKGILCLYASLDPKSFAPGRTINITNNAIASSSAKQYHHFFPEKSIAVLGSTLFKSIYNNVINIVFMDQITNDQISNRNPSDYIPDFETQNGSSAFANILESHLIQKSGFGIVSDKLDDFMQARSKRIYDELYKRLQVITYDTTATKPITF